MFNSICWTIGRYFIINVKEKKQEAVVDQLDNESYQWKDLEYNDTINLCPPGTKFQDCVKDDYDYDPCFIIH